MDKKNKNPNVPNLRFNNDPYKKYNLYEFATRVTRKNKDNVSNLPLTISAQYGLVDQVSFFNKTVASKDMSGYYLLKNGEFAYNKSYSNDYPWGAIKRLDLYDMGCLSTLYICFKTNDNIVNSNYLVHYFESSKWHKQVADIAGEGARNHGLLNIVVNDFFNTKHAVPTIENQIKIAGFLDLIEKRIQTQIKIIDDCISYRNAIVDYYFESLSGNWKKVKLSNILKEYSELHIKDDSIVHATLSKEGIFPKTDRYDRDFLVKDEDKKYKVTHLNDICYNPANLKFGVITRNTFGDCIISPIYITFKIKSGFIPKFVELLVTRKQFISKARKYEQGTVYERMSVNSSDLLSMYVLIPSFSIQQKIVNIINNIDNKIFNEQKLLNLYKLQKVYLLKNMFI
jgi:type I restriction enzyme S subunit